MGCGKSTLIQDFSDGKSPSIRDTEADKENQIGSALLKDDIDGLEEVKDLVEEMTQDDIKNSKAARKLEISRRRQIIQPKHAKGNTREVENAWVTTKERRNSENMQSETRPESQTLKIINETNCESEYGRDGFDLTSKSFVSNREKLVSSSLDKKTSLDENGFFHDGYLVGTTESQVLRKYDSDEAFDPSALIDIEKFKAANAPTKKKPNTVQDSKILNDDTNGDQVETTNIRNNEILLAPSNYHDLYDEEEKLLIESIEKDFVNSPSPVLPGAVI